MRLRLVPDETNFDFFKYARVTFGASVVAMVLSIGIWLTMGLNFGIDFLGGTTIRTEASEPWMSAPIATRWRRWALATCRSRRSSTRPSTPISTWR
jgi:preprotein translocase subunit SecF